jgi:hypothetical protein|tara:strand:+ start:333 stop:452 length:120 start_codon:yes stop_codon:yes gene_type:complete
MLPKRPTNKIRIPVIKKSKLKPVINGWKIPESNAKNIIK